MMDKKPKGIMKRVLKRIERRKLKEMTKKEIKGDQND